MNHDKNTPEGSIERVARPGLWVLTFSRASLREMFITATPVAGESVETMFGKAADVVRRSGSQVVSQEVFGFRGGTSDGARVLANAFGRVVWPVTWVESDAAAASGLGGTQIWAVRGVPVKALELAGRLVGSVFEDDGAQYCRLGGLAPADYTQPRHEQAREVLERMEAALQAVGMGFHHVLRTWFYNEDILSWYGDFNRVRNAFLSERGVFDGLVPASTGVGMPRATQRGAALVSGLLAVRPKADGVQAVGVRSPLQGPALAYGSPFSRAVELITPTHRRLMVSGTASIDREGKTAYANDVDRQVDLTMRVVARILESRGMTWSDVVRGVVYVRNASDAPTCRRYCADRDLTSLPVVVASNVICRDDLLFEIEVDAISSGTGQRPAAPP